MRQHHGVVWPDAADPKSNPNALARSLRLAATTLVGAATSWRKFGVLGLQTAVTASLASKEAPG